MTNGEILQVLKNQLHDIDSMLEVTKTFEKRASLHIAKTHVLLALKEINDSIKI